jgi:hypothetical protein
VSEPDSGAGALVDGFLFPVLEEGLGAPCADEAVPAGRPELEGFLLEPRLLAEEGGFFSSFLGPGGAWGVTSSVISFVTRKRRVFRVFLCFEFRCQVSPAIATSKLSEHVEKEFSILVLTWKVIVRMGTGVPGRASEERMQEDMELIVVVQLVTCFPRSMQFKLQRDEKASVYV